MRIKDGAMISVRNLKKRRGRTILTALGVAIGTTAIVSMLALGLGLQKNATESLGDFGDLSVLQVYPNWETIEPGEPAQVADEQIRNLESIPGVQAVMPAVSYYGMNEIKMGRQYSDARIEGIEFSKAEAFGYSVNEGTLADGTIREVMVSYRFPDDFYEKTKTRPNRAERTDDRQEPDFRNDSVEYEYNLGRLPVVGETLVISQMQYLGEGDMKKKEYKVRVAGVFQEGVGDYGSTIYLPLELVKSMNEWNTGEGPKGRGVEESQGYENVRVKVTNNDVVQQVVEEIRAQGLETWSPTDMLEELNQVFLIIQLILGGIGSVALLVATIGIVNTMTMSILERNKEIGVMKALGATIPNIKLMFLIESGVIGILGGLVGLASSYGLVMVVNLVAKNMMGDNLNSSLAVIPAWLAMAAMAFSLVIGIIAGLYPAGKAAKISPLEAIRNE
jgi:ABC-type antimicrobial peptide transport system permease subunit